MPATLPLPVAALCAGEKKKEDQPEFGLQLSIGFERDMALLKVPDVKIIGTPWPKSLSNITELPSCGKIMATCLSDDVPFAASWRTLFARMQQASVETGLLPLDFWMLNILLDKETKLVLPTFRLHPRSKQRIDYILLDGIFVRSGRFSGVSHIVATVTTTKDGCTLSIADVMDFASVVLGETNRTPDNPRAHVYMLTIPGFTRTQPPVSYKPNGSD